MKDKIHFWVTSLYCEDRKNLRYKLFEENRERVPSLQLKPSINGKNPLEVIVQWGILQRKLGLSFPAERSGMIEKWGALACYLTKLLYFVEQHDNGGHLCLIEDDVILPEGFEDYVSQVLSFSRENFDHEKIIRLGTFGEVYILPFRVQGKVKKHCAVIDQPIDHKINNSGLCFHYHKDVDEIDGYQKIINQYNPTLQKDLVKGRPFIADSLKNCLMLSKGNHGDIATSKIIAHFGHVFEHWDNTEFRYQHIFNHILIEQIISFYEEH